MLREISRYEIGTREAIIYQDEQGFYIRLYENAILMATKDAKMSTLRFAEDCAENWVHRYGNFSNGSD
jgi:hypothetical protein